MRMPKFSTLLLIAVGLFVLSAVSIAPNGTRKPVVMADGTFAHSPDGNVLTEFDTSHFLKSNWLGLTALGLAPVVLVFALARLKWPGVEKDKEDAKESA
jgi:hypothetical protein